MYQAPEMVAASQGHRFRHVENKRFQQRQRDNARA
jgi:hypothetical protein